ncbi:MAG: hypothetical protein QW076_03895 [Candidatus Anstonellales archaeon]
MVHKKLKYIEIITNDEPYKIKNLLFVSMALLIIISVIYDFLLINYIIQKELEIARNSINFVIAPLSIRIFLLLLAIILFYSIKKPQIVNQKNLFLLTFILIVTSTFETVLYGISISYKAFMLGIYLLSGMLLILTFAKEKKI